MNLIPRKFTHNKHASHSSSLLLLELIFAIFFFMVACAVCVQLFVNARLLSKDAQYLSYGVTECSNAAEIILVADSVEEMEQLFQNAFPEMTVSAGSIILPFRENSKVHETTETHKVQASTKLQGTPASPETTKAHQTHETVISYQVKDRLLTAEICFQDIAASEALYQLTIDHYLPEETDAQ